MSESEAKEVKPESQNVEEKEEIKERVGEDEKKVGEEKKQEESMIDDSIVESSINEGEKSEDADVADDEDSDSDESLPPGLLERPVEILDRKRARKKITRFTYDDEKPSTNTERKVNIMKGKGTPLREHPRVEHLLQKNTVDDLKIIHKFFYGVPGSSHSVKKDIREFSGFLMEKDSPQYLKKEEILGRLTVDNLKWAMNVCDIPHPYNRKKEELMEMFMDWCLCPTPQDLPVPTKKRSKKMENGSTTAPKKSKKVKKAKNTEKKSKKSRGKAKIKLTSPKSKTKPVNSDTSDDEPLVQKKKTPPTNTEIKKYVETLLKDADLEVMTMKVVFQQVYEKYPEFDLTDRKPFIKETVKSIIS